jgi:hypothetical protein
MASIASYVTQTNVSEQIKSLHLTLQQEKLAKLAATGVIGAGAVVTGSPPVSVDDDGITRINFPHVRPGDLITADFINALIDVVLAIDVRLQRIEALAANALERDKGQTTTNSPKV